MKKMKKLYTLLIAAALMCAAMALTACGGGNGPYKVTVKDSAGNPYGSGVVVMFMQGTTQVAMQACDENGVATKELEAGEYTIQLQFTDSNANYYYEKGITVTSKNREVEVVLMNGINESDTTDLSIGMDEYVAYNVLEGTTYTSLVNGRNYFIFTPTRAGTYEIYVEDAANATIGYYGAPHYVQANSIEEPKDGVITVSISESMIGKGDTGTTRLVLGIDVTDDSTKSGKLVVKRVGDPKWSIEDEEWTVYEVTSELVEYELPEDTVFGEFDVTAEGYTIVYNEEDGYYHLDTEDGPLVVVYLAMDPPVAYAPCFMKILEKTGVNKYFFDENGGFIKKENYSDCLSKYIEMSDLEFGVYPLTEDLYSILHQKSDWWDKDSPDFIFEDKNGNPIPGLNTEIAWLFMCGYIEE